jgi:hypothetical protein
MGLYNMNEQQGGRERRRRRNERKREGVGEKGSKTG